MPKLSLLFFLLPLFTLAQTKSTSKSLSVTIDQKDDSQREIIITSIVNGDEKVFEWSDEGTVPDNIKKQLEENNIDLSVVSHFNDNDVEILSEEKESSSMTRKIIVKRIEGDGVKIMEWNGDGEMPVEMEVILEEIDLDLDDSHDQHHRIKAKRKKAYQRAMKQGMRKNSKERIKRKKYAVGEEDSKSSSLEENKAFFWNLLGSNRQPNAYMGLHISSSEQGASVEKIQEDSPASSAQLKTGDVILRLNGARIKSQEDILSLLEYYEPNDQIELLIQREGKEKKIKLTLGQRPESFRL